MKPEPEKPSWKIRRAIIFCTLIYCFGMVTYLSIWSKGNTLQEQVAIALIALSVSVIGSYIFGAVWDDKNQKQQDAVPPHDYYNGELE